MREHLALRDRRCGRQDPRPAVTTLILDQRREGPRCIRKVVEGVRLVEVGRPADRGSDDARPLFEAEMTALVEAVFADA